MLKKIPVRSLELGMYVHSFEGSWVDHPFWRSSFVLRESRDLERARESAVEECWIDVSQGIDVEPSPAQDGDVAAAQVAPTVQAPARTPPGQASMKEELNRAAKLCRTASSQVMAMFEDARLGRTLDAERCLPLVHDISDSVTRNPGALLSLARLKTEDDYSYMHSVAVCALMVAMGRTLGFGDDACKEAGLAGLMHDIGKAFVPAAILGKPGKLDDAEFAIIKTHPQQGYDALVGAGDVSPAVLDVVLHHHERIDGKGYPHGLAGDAVSRIARMGAVCDVYDAVTSDRPYKAGWDPADAIAQMAKWEGHFDPAMLNALIRSVGIYPTGSLVRLESKRIAVVMEQNAKALTRPVVKIFFSLRSRMPVAPEVVDLASPGCSDRIHGREDIAGWNQRDIAALWAGGTLPKGFKARERATTRKPGRSR